MKLKDILPYCLDYPKTPGGEKAAKEKEKKNEYEEYLRLKQKFDKTWKNDWSSP